MSAVQLPEIRELIQVARAYVNGQAHYSEICSVLDALNGALKYVTVNDVIIKMAREWTEMAIRFWPEMLPVSDPITEEEFKEWVRIQLVVFEPFKVADQ